MPGTGEKTKISREITFEEVRKEVLNDYRVICESREASLLGRKEVLTGKAKFGIFGDGKELAQVCLAKVIRDGDFRSGYYRDQTLMFSMGLITVQQWFAQLYAHTDLEAEPMSGGRQMNGHFGTRSLNADGTWKDLTRMKNSSMDISPTGSQMPRLLGLAYASYFYRNNPQLQQPAFHIFSHKGNEIAYGSIGDASTSEGLFWETINAAGVLQVPMMISVWDDGHGISVPKKYQTTKESISEILKGFQRDHHGKGYEIFKVKGWDYVNLVKTYERAAEVCRSEHTPVLVHVEEMTQPQGHSTSGSHERYKSKERLQWEEDFDCISKMREWILSKGMASEAELEQIREGSKRAVSDAKNAAWGAFTESIRSEVIDLHALLSEIQPSTTYREEITALLSPLVGKDVIRRDIASAAKKILRLLSREKHSGKQKLADWLQLFRIANHERYSSHVYSESEQSPLKVTPVPPQYAHDEMTDGRAILRDNFDKILEKYPQVVIFGEDSGKIGGVNQGLEGLQKKYGEIRVFDTGIREATIMGQAIGLALRGIRPIAEIQYLDYLLYALQIMSDDLATVQYRTKGGQKAPVIIRTRGHRLEGIWHSGSPMGMIIHAVRGVHVCVPRNMTQAAGMYNTLLKGDDPAILIEPLNSYRLKERTPSNLGEFCVPLGTPEILCEGNDITLISYGPNCKIALEASEQLREHGISLEIIDVQTLLPFDLQHMIVRSLQKTNRVIFMDEDVPGGSSAYMMQKVLEEQGGYLHLDSVPRTLTAKEHRPAYGSDGDYFSKPGIEDVFDLAYSMMHEADPERFPAIY
ncbi:MAG: transketolase [Bacteroidia bacterium]|nr:transketolase [Bacteroidia bacterium]